jgi:hypothetical protein
MRSDHLIISEKDLFSFLALFAALFSIKVFSGFFFSCFLLSLPLLMIVSPYFSERIYPPQVSIDPPILPTPVVVKRLTAIATRG